MRRGLMAMANDIPRPSATVVLLRDGDGGLETYLVRRHSRVAFGDAWAFPGGLVDASDARVHGACRGVDPDSLNRLLEAGCQIFITALEYEQFQKLGARLRVPSHCAQQVFHVEQGYLSTQDAGKA